MGLVVNESKTMSMLLTRGDAWHIDSQITADNYTFDAVKGFNYLGFAVATKNDVSLEIKCRTTLANRRYYGLNRQLSRNLSYDKTNTLQGTHPTRASLRRRAMDTNRHWYSRLDSIWEKKFRKIFQCELAMISAFEATVYSVLISSGCVGSAMLF